MKLIFEIEYHTQPGEHLCITGDIASLGENNTHDAPAMSGCGNGLQRFEAEVSPATSSVSYRYALRSDSGKILRHEWGKKRTIRFDSHLQSALITDHWQDRPTDKPFYSTLFTECVCRRPSASSVHSLKSGMLQIQVDAPLVVAGTTLAIVGSEPAIGAWDPQQAILMNGSEMPRWNVQLPLDDFAGRRVEFKFIILRDSDGEVIGWENGPNRYIDIPAKPSAEALLITGLHFDSPIAPWHGAGVAIPVFSLRSEDDFGVGDFYDLKMMVDWAAATGQKVIQILPINDTTMTHTWRDCYPYNANSCFALHPMYLRLSRMGQLDDADEQARFDRIANELNQLPTVDYEKVNSAKNGFTRLLFRQQGKAEMTSAEFKKFFAANSHWLKPYAAFCTLRDINGTANMADWGEWAEYSPSRIEKLSHDHSEQFDYVYYIQYHLDRQLRHVRDYAHSKGVAIKGDIPIGISRNSVDAWTMPRLFNLDCSAGAPPDDFSILGQKWGFPTYNWEEMARDGFAWWKDRLRKMAEYFDAYRIDHILGFFRIWQIPLSQIHGLLGIFNPALPLSPEEMAEKFGFRFDSDTMTRPIVTESMLAELFGDLADTARKRLLITQPDGTLCPAPEAATQRKAIALIDNTIHFTDPTSRSRLREGMLRLLDDVLFIEDPTKKGHYHPRIAANRTFAFQSLDETGKDAFGRLYEDFFYHRNDELWRDKAMWKLPHIIDVTDMLSCAEDLGMIPACVPEVMSRLQILSLEIQRMPKAFTEFANPATYPYLSVCSTSTHDMPGLRQWWEDDHSRAQRFYNSMLGHEGEAPHHADANLCREIIEMNLGAPSMLCILPLQDWLSIDQQLRRDCPADEQINDPSNPDHYWRYRMHISLEKLCHSKEFNSLITSLISKSGR